MDALLRVAVELFYRSDCVKAHLAEVQALPAPEYQELASAVTKALDDVEKPAIEAIKAIGEVGEKAIGPGLFDALARFSHWFAVAHELLVYLPAPNVLTETRGIIEEAFASDYDGLAPAIILGSLFNAFQFDFYQKLGRVLPDFRKISPPAGKRPVLQLPVCDRRCPAAWAVLGHEMGHAIDDNKEISHLVLPEAVPGIDRKNAAFEILSCWAREFCADLLAAEVCGPTAIMALLSLEYCVFPLRPVHRWSNTHPATKWRLEVVSVHLEKKYGADFLKPIRQAYDRAWQYSVDRTCPDEEKRRHFEHQEKLMVEKFVCPLADSITSSLPKSENGHQINDDSLTRCLRRLKGDTPIGAQGLPRRTLRARIEDYRSKTFSAAGERVMAFHDLATHFREDPLPAPALLFSSAKHRETIFDEAANRLIVDGDAGIKWLLHNMARADELSVRSIGSAMVQQCCRNDKRSF
ncbi:MAG: hypothetical protein HY763_04500 [Planctomycetes bacterium]|nr:hypothetical protein [Planctomycetota bacterium]